MLARHVGSKGIDLTQAKVARRLSAMHGSAAS